MYFFHVELRYWVKEQWSELATGTMEAPKFADLFHLFVQGHNVSWLPNTLLVPQLLFLQALAILEAGQIVLTPTSGRPPPGDTSCGSSLTRTIAQPKLGPSIHRRHAAGQLDQLNENYGGHAKAGGPPPLLKGLFVA